MNTPPSALFEGIDPDIQYHIRNSSCEQALPSLPAESFDLILSSPPYNIGKEYEVKTAIEAYLASQEEIIAELVRLLSPNGSLCWQVGNYVEAGEIFPLDIFYYPIFKKHGLKLRNRMVWRFGHGLHASKRFSGRYETLLWFTKSDDYIFNLDAVRVPSKYPGKRPYKGDRRGELSGNPKGKNPSDVWEILLRDWEESLWDIPNVKNNHPEKTGHPCQFPIELVERCVLALTHEQSWVLDPFAGVGSTVLGAVKNRRHAIGIEQDAGYCRIAEEQLALLKSGRLRYRPMTKPIHQPKQTDKIAQLPLEWRDQNKTNE